MLFEAVEELKDKIDRLEKAKNSVGGFGTLRFRKRCALHNIYTRWSPRKDSF